MNKFLQIINIKSLVVTVSSVISTYVCIRYEIHADFSLTLIATAVIFPIVFSISGAYKRRETALGNYGVIKAYGQSIFLATRDWMESPTAQTLDRARALQGNLLESTRVLFSDDVAKLRSNEKAVYAAFSELSKFIKTDLRGNGLAATEVSRCNQYLTKMIAAFENTKHIYQYRTPRTLRAFSAVFIFLVPVLYGPYFAFQAAEYSPQVTYVMPILFSLVLVSLYNIQNHLENPFDGIGEDDVSINVEDFLKRLAD